MGGKVPCRKQKWTLCQSIQQSLQRLRGKVKQNIGCMGEGNRRSKGHNGRTEATVKKQGKTRVRKNCHITGSDLQEVCREDGLPFLQRAQDSPKHVPCFPSCLRQSLTLFTTGYARLALHCVCQASSPLCMPG